MNPITNNAPRFFPALILLGYSMATLFAARLPIPANWPVATQGLPTQIGPWAVYCIVVGLLCAWVDRADGVHAVGAYRLFGRWFWLAGTVIVALSVGLALSRISYPDDLLRPGRATVAGIVALVTFVVLSYLSQQRQPPTVRHEAIPTKRPGERRTKALLATVLTGIAAFMLYQRYAEKVDNDRSYDQRDFEERQVAAAWQHDVDFFRGGETVEEVTAKMRRERYNLRCYSDLRSEERLQADDRSSCWANIGVAWEQPALAIGFAFGEHGLRDYVLRFPGSSWNGVQSYLDRTGRRLDLTLGADRETNGPVFGWAFASGLVMSAAPAPGGQITVFWQAKDEVAKLHCPYQQPRRAKVNPNGITVPLSKVWPGIDCDKAMYGS